MPEPPSTSTGDAMRSRVASKVVGACSVGAAAGSLLAVSRSAPVLAYGSTMGLNAAVGMGAFSVLQEGFRALRHGHHDAWNSFAAGSLAGAALVGVHAGRRYCLVGGLAWGSICSLAHSLWHAVDPRRSLLEPLLVYGGLLEEAQLHGRSRSSSSQVCPEGGWKEQAREAGSSQQHGSSSARGEPVQQRQQQQADVDAVPLGMQEAMAAYEKMDYKERALLLQEIKERELRALWGDDVRAAAAAMQGSKQ